MNDHKTNLSHADYEHIRGLILDVMDDFPTLSCEDFQHTKRDFHRGYECPVEHHFYNRLNKLLREFGIAEVEHD